MIKVDKELYIAQLVKSHFNKSSTSKVFSKLFLDCIIKQMFFENKEAIVVIATYVKHRLLGIWTYKEEFYIQGYQENKEPE